MKVVHISSSDSGGAGIAAVRLNNALNAAGVESELLCVHRSSNNPNVVGYKRSLWSKVITHSGLPIGQNKYLNHVADFEGNYEACSFPEANFDISDATILKDADVINLHWVGNILNYQKFFSRLNKPIVWTLHDMNPFMGIAHYMGDYLANEEFRDIEDKVRAIKLNAIHKYDNLDIVCLCDWMKQYSMQSDVFKHREHHIIPNSIDTNVFCPQDTQSCRKELGIPLNKRVLLFCAQSILNRRKGFDLLLAALPEISQDCFLVIIGKADGIAVPSNIPFKSFGTIRDEVLMSKIYAAADAFVLPSREDNLPNTMLESLCCGTPVITFTNGGMVNTVEDGVSGVLIEQQTPQALANGINSFLTEFHFNRVLIAEDAKRKFAPATQAAAYIDLYNKLIRG